MEKLCYASYVCEFMSYYTREGSYCVNELNLLYVTLKALEQGTVDNQLIRYVFEVRLMDIEGQGIDAASSELATYMDPLGNMMMGQKLRIRMTSWTKR